MEENDQPVNVVKYHVQRNGQRHQNHHFFQNGLITPIMLLNKRYCDKKQGIGQVFLPLDLFKEGL